MQEVETSVLCNIGSGLKTFHRQMRQFLKLVGEDRMGEVAITCEDRLIRSGQEYLAMRFACSGVALMVREPGEEHLSPETC